MATHGHIRALRYHCMERACCSLTFLNDFFYGRFNKHSPFPPPRASPPSFFIIPIEIPTTVCVP